MGPAIWPPIGVPLCFRVLGIQWQVRISRPAPADQQPLRPRQELPGPWTRSGVFGGRVGKLLPIGSDQLISAAGACTGFGRASDGSDFDTDLSRNVYLVPLIASASLIWHGTVSKA